MPTRFNSKSKPTFGVHGIQSGYGCGRSLRNCWIPRRKANEMTMKPKNQPLKGYAQQYRSGLTMKEKWATEKRIAEEKQRTPHPARLCTGSN